MGRTAVVRIVVDADGSLSVPAFAAGVARLRELGRTVVAPPAAGFPDRDREVELIVEDARQQCRLDDLVADCKRAFDRPAALGVMTYISRGTDADARGILQGFDIGGEVLRTIAGDDELVTVTVQASDLRRVPESRLQTALEAALNCEVRIVVG